MLNSAYADEQLARAATCYVMPEGIRTAGIWNLSLRYRIWPWADRDWKSENRISDLIKASALIIREIERLQQNDDKMQGNTERQYSV
jgi:hypothetical protein